MKVKDLTNIIDKNAHVAFWKYDNAHNLVLWGVTLGITSIFEECEIINITDTIIDRSTSKDVKVHGINIVIKDANRG